MTPETILQAMVAAYSTCLTYRDQGQVETRFLNSGTTVDRVSTKPFRTAFIRPGQFRFEYRNVRTTDDAHVKADEDDRYIVWASGGDTRVWSYIRPETAKAASLGRALAGATGVSSGSAHTVPALLMYDQIGGRSLVKLRALELLSDQEIADSRCYRIEGRFAEMPMDPADNAKIRADFLRKTGRPFPSSKAGPTTLWVDQRTFLLRRIEETTVFDTFKTEQVTDYEPEAGVAISDDDLRFDPPVDVL